MIAPSRIARQRVYAALFTLSLGAACTTREDTTAVAPAIPGAPVIPPQFRNAAFLVDVSPSRGSVRVSAPVVSPATRQEGSLLSAVVPQLSLLGADVIELSAANLNVGPVGDVAPGKREVTLTLRVTNRLDGITLRTPTFPTPPSGVTGVLAFPLEISTIETAGGVASNGNQITVQSPRYGSVTSSNRWSGAPHNFFNDAGCVQAANDCFRYARLSTIFPLGDAETSVGFLIDPTVGDFRVRVVVAADVSGADPGATTFGPILVSSGGGRLYDVAVTATPSGGATIGPVFSTLVGVATFPTLSRAQPIGVLTFANVPPQCENPGPQVYNLNSVSGRPFSINFNCVEEPVEYRLRGEWGPIVSGGPTGRRVELSTFAEMGDAPGRFDVAGPFADPLDLVDVTIEFQRLRFSRRTFLPDYLAAGLAVPSDVGRSVYFAAAAPRDGGLTGRTLLGRLEFDVPAGPAAVEQPAAQFGGVLAAFYLTGGINLRRNMRADFLPLTIPAF